MKYYGLLLLLLVSCLPNLEEGHVIEKKYEPPRKYSKTYTTSHKIGDLRFYNSTTKNYLDDEDYILIIKGVVPDHKEELVEKIQRVYVSKEIYDAYSVDDYIIISEEMSFSDYDQEI